MNKVTVLIPVYNTKAAHLMEAVMSIINQTVDVPIVIVDDNSTDEWTLEAIHLLKEQFSEKITVFFMENNGGTSAAMNFGHQMIKTEYIAVMGSDDISDRNRLALQMKFAEENPQIDVIGAQLFSFYDDDIRRTVAWTSSHPQFPNTNVGDSGTMFLANHGTVLYKNQSVKDAGGYDLGYRRGQDARLWRDMAAKGMKFANLPQVLYAWRRFR